MVEKHYLRKTVTFLEKKTTLYLRYQSHAVIPCKNSEFMSVFQGMSLVGENSLVCVNFHQQLPYISA